MDVSGVEAIVVEEMGNQSRCGSRGCARAFWLEKWSENAVRRKSLVRETVRVLPKPLVSALYPRIIGILEMISNLFSVIASYKHIPQLSIPSQLQKYKTCVEIFQQGHCKR